MTLLCLSAASFALIEKSASKKVFSMPETPYIRSTKESNQQSYSIGYNTLNSSISNGRFISHGCVCITIAIE